MTSYQIQKCKMFKRLSLFFFFFFALLGIYIIFIPQILSNLGYSSIEIGAIFSTVPLIRFILPFVFKKFELNSKILKYSSIGLVVSAIIFYLSIENFWLFFIANLYFGVCMGIILPYIESFAMEFLKKQGYGKARLFGSIGFITSSLILANLLTNIKYGLYIFIICSCFCSFFSMPIIEKFKNKCKKTNTNNNINIIKHFSFWLSLFLIQVSFGAFYNFFTIYETSHEISLNMISYLWTFGVICEIILFYNQAPILQKFSSINLIKFSFLVTSLRWFLLYIAPSSLFFTFLSQSLHAISFALLHTATFAYLQSIYKNTKQASQFYYGIAYGLGGFTGSLVAGVSYGENIFLVSFFISIISFFVLIKSEKNHEL